MSTPLALLLAQAVEDPAHVAELLGQILLVLVSFFAITLGIGWALVRSAKARDGSSDAVRIRSCASFTAVVPAQDPLGFGAIVDALRGGLVERGGEVGPAEEVDRRVCLPLEFAGHQFVLVVAAEAERMLVSVCDRRAANRPATESSGAPLDGRALRRLLEAVDRVLRGNGSISGVRWHKREDWSAGDRTVGGHEPVVE